MKQIGIFINHPECSEDCVNGMKHVLGNDYNITTFGCDQVNAVTMSKLDMVAFPGGIGDASSYDRFFRRRAQNIIADYVVDGGRYLGICMGAYWASSHYFDILDGVDAVQYIKRPEADVRRPYGTVATVQWKGVEEKMYFYDGCALIGDETKFETIARYANGDPMAIIQGRIGLIGCHPEASLYWYEKPWGYINKYWNGGRHHDLLLQFVNELIEK